MNARHAALLTTVAIAVAATSGCADRVERAYQDCMAKVEQGAADSRTDTQPAGAAIADAMGDFARTAGTAACGAMRDTCRTNEDGPVCAAAMASLRSE